MARRSPRPRRDDDDTVYSTFFGIGQAGSLEPEGKGGKPTVKLYVPDPEQRNGWREHWFGPEDEPKPGARPIGFGR